MRTDLDSVDHDSAQKFRTGCAILFRMFGIELPSVGLFYSVAHHFAQVFSWVSSLISARKGNGLIFSREKKKCFLVLHFAYKATSVDGLIDGPRDVSHP